MDGTIYDKYRVTADNLPNGSVEWTVWKVDDNGNTYHEGETYNACVVGYAPTNAQAHRDGWQCVVVLEAPCSQ